MKNKEVALRVGTTERVVKNYLRKVCDKIGVADRQLELAWYCLNHRVVDNAKVLALLLPDSPPPFRAMVPPTPLAAGATAGAAAVASVPSVTGNFSEKQTQAFSHISAFELRESQVPS